MRGGARWWTRALRAVAPALGVLTVLAVSAGGASGATPAAPAYADYVALGDSYTADVFTGPLPPTTQFVPLMCGQSPADYPHQIARMLRVAQFHDQSCGSATTADMTRPQSLELGEMAAPQFDALSQATDLVTLGIGGNDVGFVTDAEQCLNLVPEPVAGAPEGLGGSCEAAATAGGTDRIAQAIAAAEPKVEAALAGIRARAPHARILLVNYLDAVPLDGHGCWPTVPVQDEDMAYLAAKFVQMNDMLATAATAQHVQLVDTFTPTIGHDVCQAPWVRDVEGVIPLSLNPPDLNFPMHPNGAGARAQAAAVGAAIEVGG
jgi:lysophospholipase L1-like esterase